MTLLFFDGFDARDTGIRWSVTETPAYTSSTRYGQGSAYAPITTALAYKSFTPSAKVYVGFAYKPTSISSIRGIIALYGDNGATAHVNLRNTISGGIGIYRGNTLVTTSAAGVISNDNWYYIELMATVADSGGLVEVRVNGNSVVSFTGDTKNAGTSTNMDTIAFGYFFSSTTYGVFDDVYVCNDQGTQNNNFLGDVMVQTIVPNGAGSSTDLTPHGSATNYMNVAEIPYSVGDYNSSNVSGAKDLYTFGDLAGSTTTVYGVQTGVVAARTDVGSGSVRPILKSGGTVYNDTTVSLGPSSQYIGNVRETDPATGTAWTVSGVNGIEAGVEVI